MLEARRTTADPDLLRQLAQDPIRPVRIAVARNLTTPPDALARLLSDADPHVVWNALLNRATPSDALASLAERADLIERDLIPHHPNAPVELRGRCRCPGYCHGVSAFRRR